MHVATYADMSHVGHGHDYGLEPHVVAPLAGCAIMVHECNTYGNVANRGRVVEVWFPCHRVGA